MIWLSNRQLSVLLLLIALAMCGCAHQPNNPSFSTGISAARSDLGRMESHPHHLCRPLVVIGGMLDPGVAAYWQRWEFSELTGDQHIIAIPLGECMSFEECRRKIVDAVNEVYTHHPSDRTVDVDVVGYSLGGLAARYAANPPASGPRLSISRLFTISSPNQGALAAQQLPLLHPLQKDLRPGSKLLARLNETRPDYSIYSYVCLSDAIVGEKYAALPGERVWWVPDAPMTTPHAGAFYDPRILADIARRLRDEPALAMDPPSVLPHNSQSL
jgi:pimeloyl-ACP methyl ester carboxylesterase